MKNKHDALVNIVEKELQRRGFDNIVKFREYSYKQCGEIDIYATKNNYVLLFEIKTNHTYKAQKKAREQLLRAENNCFKNNRVFKFYVTNVSNPKYEWIRR
jgi:Holliday junction resolvase-like predicted endonuclease